MKKLILLCGVAGPLLLQAATTKATTAAAAKTIECRRFMSVSPGFGIGAATLAHADGGFKADSTR
ncbi:hypothetical protein [Variovorax sp. M-6]|uniref:hypothetical protein n=1 Tax=Variovorax sp. M-6 TaxID=3233041 RepID=UPI003F9DB7EA